MLENSRSAEGQVVASIGRNKGTLAGNEDNLIYDDMDADYSNREKFEFESDHTLHAALHESTIANYQIQTKKHDLQNQNPMEH